jgi:hypothetical protein
MSREMRRLRIMHAVSTRGDGYHRSIMRGEQGPMFSDATLAKMLDLDLQHVTGDPQITVPEFAEMCRQVRHQAAHN